MKFLSGISEVIDDYNYFIFDVWGIIHDGIELYPQVIESLEFLNNNKKKICFLSNAPRRSFKLVEIFKKLGIDENIYDFIITSGEATFDFLRKNQQSSFKEYGKNYFYIGPDKDIDLLDGLLYKRVMNAKDADFVITTGFDNDFSVLEEKIHHLAEAKNHNLKMICVNPDLVVVRKNGQEVICAGALAAKYEKLGGHVIYFGKPFSSVYQMVYKEFGEPNKSKIIAIGDGLETDIKGAEKFGIDSILSTSGILANRLNVKFSQDADEQKLTKVCEEFNTFPKFIISNLKI